jgi:PAS domain S-box-containing protein
MSRYIARLVLPFLPKGIRARLFLLIALVLGPILLLLGWIYYQRYNNRKNFELQSQLDIATVIASNFKTYLESIYRESHVTGKAIMAFDPFTTAKAAHVLNAFVRQYSGIRNMSWVSTEGIVIASSQQEFIGYNLSHRAYFQQVLQGREWAISDVMVRGSITNAPIVVVATSVRDNDGSLQGMVVAGIDPSQLQTAVFQGLRTTGGAAYEVFDSKGVVVLCSDDTLLNWEQRSQWIETDHLLRRTLETQQPSVGVLSLAYVQPERTLSARVPIPDIGWVAGTGRSADAAFQTIRKDLSQDALIALVVCAGGFLLAYFISITISGPIRLLQTDAQKMGSGKIRTFRDPQAPVEIQGLREQVEHMAADLITQARQLRESEATMRTIFNSTYDAILLLDDSGHIVDVNKTFERLFGIGRDQAQNLTIGDISSESAPFSSLPQLYHDILKGQPQLIEWKARRISDSQVFDAEVFLRMVTMQGRQMVLANIRDITDRKATERHLLELTSDLSAKNEELESIISITSHDLKSPVVNIMGFSGELSRSIELLREKLAAECRNRDILSVLETEIPEEVDFIQRSTRSIDQMLESLSKVVHTVLAEIRPTKVDVNPIVMSIVSGFSTKIEASGIALTIAPLPPCIADPGLLREVLFNLIENAITYLVPGRPGKVAISGFIKNQYAIYSVQDNGRGIAVSHQHNIFKLFHRLDLSEKGEGIGLTISKRLVERQSGNMWVESEPGKGSTFFVAMPRA